MSGTDTVQVLAGVIAVVPSLSSAVIVYELGEFPVPVDGATMVTVALATHLWCSEAVNIVFGRNKIAAKRSGV